MNKFIPITLLLTTLLAGCSEGAVSYYDSSIYQSQTTSSQTITTHQVTFESRGGSYVSSLSINHNALLGEPFSTRTGYDLEGWYRSTDQGNSFSQKWNFYQDRVTESFTLYANWSINQYTISFESNGGSYVAPMTHNYGEYIYKPTNPTRSNYTFDNWYSDASFYDVFMFNTMPAQNLTLYAKWNVASIGVTSVSFDYDKIGLAIGDTHTIIASVSPSDATNKTLTWYSSNSSVASVSSSGYVVAIAYGKVTISASSTNGVVARANVTVFYDIGDKTLWELEPNYSKSLSDLITYNGTTVYGANGSKSDIDYFSVYLTAGDYVTILFAGQYAVDEQYYLIGFENSSTTLTAMYGSTNFLRYYITTSAYYYIGVIYSSSSPFSNGAQYALYVYWF